jgi:hypothetical protein
MPGGPPLSKSDIQAEPAREVAYYGGVRQGFEQARAGIDAVLQHLSGLLAKRPDNVRLERYIRQLTKLSEKLHKLQMRSSRVRDQRVERQKSKGPGGNFLSPTKARPFISDPRQDREDSLKSDFNPGGPASDEDTVGPRRRP